MLGKSAFVLYVKQGHISEYWLFEVFVSFLKILYRLVSKCYQHSGRAKLVSLLMYHFLTACL